MPRCSPSSRPSSRGVLPTIGDASNTLSMIHGADAAAACIAALTAEVPSGSTYFIDDGHVYGFRQLLEGIEDALGKKAFVRINLADAGGVPGGALERDRRQS